MSLVSPCETHTFLPTKSPLLYTFLCMSSKHIPRRWHKKKRCETNFLSSMTNWQPFGGTKSVAQAKKWRWNMVKITRREANQAENYSRIIFEFSHCKKLNSSNWIDLIDALPCLTSQSLYFNEKSWSCIDRFASKTSNENISTDSINLVQWPITTH